MTILYDLNSDLGKSLNNAYTLEMIQATFPPTSQKKYSLYIRDEERFCFVLQATSRFS